MGKTYLVEIHLPNDETFRVGLLSKPRKEAHRAGIRCNKKKFYGVGTVVTRRIT